VFRQFVKVVEENRCLEEEQRLHVIDKDRWIQRKAVKLEDGLVECWQDITEKKEKAFKSPMPGNDFDNAMNNISNSNWN
jgi:hypothetical protein